MGPTGAWIIGASSTWSLPPWLQIFIPVGGLLGTFLLVAVSTHPLWWRRNADRKEAYERQIATQDAMLGRPADPNTGRPRQIGLYDVVMGVPADPMNGQPRVPGLVEKVDALDRKLGTLNGRSVADRLGTLEKEQRRLRDQEGSHDP